MYRLVALFFVASVALVGCSSSIESEVSAECEASIVTLASVEAGDFEAEDDAITESTRACATADEYLAAVKANPGSWLYDDAGSVKDELVLMSACADNAGEPMCVDAKGEGLIE